MAAIIPSGGVSEREPTLIGDAQFQDCDGAEYRVGQQGVYVARGRDLQGTITGVTGIGLYEAGFDGTSQYVVAHAGSTYYSARIVSGSLTFAAFDTIGSTALPIVGSHFANRQYVANGAQNRRFEATATGMTSFPVGMSTTTFAVGVSVTQGAGTMSATTGLEYWVTEYDSVRGIESIHGATANTGAFSLLNSVVVTVTGVSANIRGTSTRWYRSVDGGGYPDGWLIRETAIGTTQITDTDAATGSLGVPLYGIVGIGGLDEDRDVPPGVLNLIFGPFQDSLLGVAADEPRVLRFTPAGYPDSWPPGYGIPLETDRRDEIVSGVVLPGRIGVFCNDSMHVIYRLPRDSDSVFAAGEMQEVITKARGGVSRRGACTFTPIGGGPLAAVVSRDGIWATNLSPTSSPIPITDGIDWEGRVDIDGLSSCRLVDDTINRRLAFLHRRASDTTHATGLWYLDYQQYDTYGLRVTFADHGPLADAITHAAADGSRRVFSIDSRSGNGQVYLEATQDADESLLRDASGSVRFRLRTKEYLTAGARGTARLGTATWMHDAGPARIEHRLYFDRRDSNPEVKTLESPTIRNADEVYLGRDVNSVSLEIESVGTTSYGVHWIDIEGFDVGQLGARKGA